MIHAFIHVTQKCIIRQSLFLNIDMKFTLQIISLAISNSLMLRTISDTLDEWAKN